MVGCLFLPFGWEALAERSLTGARKTAPECPNPFLQARRGKTSNREFDLTIGTLSPVLDDTNVPIAGTTIDDFPSFRARLGKWQGKTRPRCCTRHFICEITRSHLKVLHLPSMLGPKNGQSKRAAGCFTR
jgi:hypothetical protein